MKGVTQLQSIITGMCNSGKATRKDDPRALLQSCVKSVLEMALQGLAMLDGAKEQDVERKERHDITKATATATVTATPSSLTPAVPDASIDGDESKKLFKTKNEEILLRQTSRLQMEIYDTIIALRQNDIAWNNLNGIKKYLYCLSESSVLLVYVTVILICMSPSCPKYIHTHKHTHTNTHAHTHSLALSLSLSLSLMSLTLPPPPLHYTTPPYRRTAP
jgi:hypothetical protein